MELGRPEKHSPNVSPATSATFPQQVKIMNQRNAIVEANIGVEVMQNKVNFDYRVVVDF